MNNLENTISKLDNFAVTYAETVEHIAHLTRKANTFPLNCLNLHYRYLITPFYKTCVGYIGEVAATGLTFLASDLLIHQLTPQVLECAFSKLPSDKLPEFIENLLGLDEQSCEFTYSPHFTFFWMSLAIPVMYAKYRRSQVRM